MLVTLVVGSDEDSASVLETREPPFVAARIVVVHDRVGITVLVLAASCFQGGQRGGAGPEDVE
ncbi:hypothetical protein [Nocardiopsis metallicus]|uniref:Uncharacterized protein n=1 Tax=Nocardiopsis metallicus TaxID=179819 RepID=A0A840W8E7_9ACTN|nr:hypothetical protein [Nocardiopsis metallicus]MBB5492322.1 hypothetical protein [Nocardiopsis metallicus]